MIRTKIVATMGPACAEAELLVRLFEAGVSVCRLNFSHGDLEGHGRTLRLIREAAERFRRPIAVLGDLGGPKIRLGKVADEGGAGGMAVQVGDELVIQREPIVGHDGRVSTNYDKFVDDVQVGNRILIDDGLLHFVCTDKDANELRCSCTAGGVLRSAKGINLPSTKVTVPSLTDRDWECADWAVDNDLDYLALSFVRRADDLKMLRWQLQRRHSDIQLVAKIEKAEALQEIDGIIDQSDGLMVARGDLGVEMDVAQVPLIQKSLIRKCQAAGKPVIVATQMLQSMVEQSSPTRAEVSDVANAILDGTDAVMLSAETSVGKHPLLAVHTMNHVAEVTEHYLDEAQTESAAAAPKVGATEAAAALARGAWRIVQDLRPKLVVIWSQTGETARVFSKHRFPVPILALSANPRALRKMSMYHGVIPHAATPAAEMGGLIADADALVRQERLAEAGDKMVLVAGWSPALPSTMNGIIIHTVGEKWAIVRPANVPPSAAAAAVPEVPR